MSELQVHHWGDHWLVTGSLEANFPMSGSCDWEQNLVPSWQHALNSSVKNLSRICEPGNTSVIVKALVFVVSINTTDQLTVLN